MSETKTQLMHIASLAYIRLNQNHEESMTKDISNILNFVKKLESIDTQSVEPLMHPLDMNQRLREDIPDHTCLSNELESIAPDFEDGYYLVPKVIETGKNDG
tara:strand:- start:193 stop:498 length:306 start_codon:yes stop_codon:yes gene_type:complete